MSDGPEVKEKLIFLVEDNKADVRLIQEALKHSPIAHRIVTVQNGIEAMDYLQKHGEFATALDPDLILLDLNLPRKDGREVLAEIKADPKLRRIPVIVLTTSRNEEDIARSYDLHANCYITKSRNIKDLFAIVRRIEEFWLTTVTLPSEI